MSDYKRYSLLGLLHEINRREFKNKLSQFPEDLRYYATVANSIIGAENAKRISETPAGVAENSEEFVSGLLEITSLEDSGLFAAVLGTCLIETVKDELKFCCLNCTLFESCLDIGNHSVGALFYRRVHGEETSEIRENISREVESALRNAPFVFTDEAHRLCSDFSHQYNPSNIGEIFGRYTDIAQTLHNQYGLDYQGFLREIVSVNMIFFEKCNEGIGQQ